MSKNVMFSKGTSIRQVYLLVRYVFRIFQLILLALLRAFKDFIG